VKHLYIFEQFVLESANKRIQQIEAELAEIEAQMAEVQDAMDNGDMDEDEAELQLSDLDGNKLDLEGELSNLREKESRKMLPFLSKLMKTTENITGQSTRWMVKLEYAPAEEKSTIEHLLDRDQTGEEKELQVFQKMVEHCEKARDGFTPDQLSMYSHIKDVYVPAMQEFLKAGAGLNAIREACEEYGQGCDKEKEYKKAYDPAFANYQKATADLREMGKLVGIRV